MTALNQDFTVNNGDDYTVLINNFNANGGKYDLTGATVTWTFHTPTPIVKSKQIAIDRNTMNFPLDSSDTLGLSGTYPHECKVVDIFGKHFTLFKGNGTIV